jgi:hypothetical protein
MSVQKNCVTNGLSVVNTHVQTIIQTEKLQVFSQYHFTGISNWLIISEIKIIMCYTGELIVKFNQYLVSSFDTNLSLNCM